MLNWQGTSFDRLKVEMGRREIMRHGRKSLNRVRTDLFE